MPPTTSEPGGIDSSKLMSLPHATPKVTVGNIGGKQRTQVMQKMEEALVKTGVNPKAAKIITKMAKPEKFVTVPGQEAMPDKFPRPGSEVELKTLATLLKQGPVTSKV